MYVCTTTYEHNGVPVLLLDEHVIITELRDDGWAVGRRVSIGQRVECAQEHAHTRWT